VLRIIRLLYRQVDTFNHNKNRRTSTIRLHSCIAQQSIRNNYSIERYFYYSMPRRAKRNNRRRKSSSGPSRSIGGADRTVTIPGKLLINVAISSTAGTSIFTLPVNPSSIDSTRLTALNSSFELFRFVSINLRIYPAVTDTPGRTPMAVSYSKVDNAPAAGLDKSYIAPTSRYIDSIVTVPVNMKLGRSDLLNSTNPWWATGDIGGEATDYVQGYLHFNIEGAGVTVDSSTIVECSYVVCFRSPTTQVIPSSFSTALRARASQSVVGAPLLPKKTLGVTQPR
jgi:hypothetical protein